MARTYLVLAVMALAVAAAPAAAGNGRGNGGGNGGGNNGGGGPTTTPRACALSDIAPAAIACTGFFADNLLSGNTGDRDAQAAALADLGFAWDKNFGAVTKIDSLNGNTTVDFSTANQNPLTRLYGETFIGLHFGNGAGLGGNATAFYKFDAGLAGLASFMLNIVQGSSGAVLYRTGTAPVIEPPGGGTGSTVPEPASWAMMIAGFGLVGAAMRRRAVSIA